MTTVGHKQSSTNGDFVAPGRDRKLPPPEHGGAKAGIYGGQPSSFLHGGGWNGYIDFTLFERNG